MIVNPAPAVQDIAIIKSAGYEEGAYAKWEAVDGADGYMAYIASAGGRYARIDDDLIRKYDSYWRVDTVGLAKGTYYMKVDAVVLGEENGTSTATVIATSATKALKVTNYDRSGFAFSEQSPCKTGSGAYNDDGTLKDNAQVIYVTKDTAKTCKAMIHINGEGKPAQEVTGIQAILDAKQKKGTSNDILDIRVIGCVNKEDLDYISSSTEGIQIKGSAARTPMNITLEGIGEDAAVKGFGFLIRNCGNVELRNFGILDFMDDGVSIDTDNCNLWIHDLDLFYGQAGGDSDQKKGDGTIDIKLSQYCTVSYNHFWDSGKSCLIDASPKTENYADYLTYHHNWFDHSDSRHPRIRNGHNFHIYNNYYDGNSKYGVGSTTGSSAFVEANYFENCNYPMMISKQGTDALGTGTFSSEAGGMIKAYANHIEGAKSYLPYSSTNKTEFDAYEVKDASEQVPESVKTKAGATAYNNFDTSDIMYSYAAEAAADAKETVQKYAGRLNGGDLRWTFDASENTNFAVIPALKELVVNYKASVKVIGGGVAGNPVIMDGDDTTTAPGEDLPSVSEPKADKPTDTKVEKGTKITLSCDTAGAEIYYTINGGVPTQNSTRYTGAIEITGTTTIRAIAILGTATSDVRIFKYTVPGEPGEGDNTGGDDNPGDNTEIKAPYPTVPEGEVPKGTKVELKCDTPDAKIYYTLDDTAPTEDSTLHTEPIEINTSTTIKAFAVKEGYMSSPIATFKYSVIGEGSQEPTVPEGVGLRIAFKKAGETYTYTYTGSAIKPEIVVWNNSDKLVEGTDYTVKYTNNVNASAGAKENKKPKITVTGKGNLTGNAAATFEIQKKQLENVSEEEEPVVVGGVTDNGELLVVEKSKITPTVYYGGVKLTNKDYSISKTDKCVRTDDGKEITITGKGNFAGTRTYKLKVIGKNKLKKFTVSFVAPNFTYDGEPKRLELKNGDVKDADGKALTAGTDYTVVYQKDLTSAGTVKFTVAGLGYYTGSVTKSYTIKPNAVTSGMEITGVSSAPYPYTGIGVTIPTAGVSYQGTPLEEGRDYKLAYGSNKKVGAAKLTVSFMGNYKGSKALSKTFTIGANSLTDETQGVKLVIPNMVFNKPGVYKSKPYVSVNGVEVKASEYTVKYYTDEGMASEMGKIMEADKAVHVKIEGKDKGNYKGMVLKGSYMVQKKAEGAIDLSKAKVTVTADWSDSAAKTNKLEYTGTEIEPGVMIEIKQGNVKLSPKDVKQLMDEQKLTITYTNNIHKGKASIIINGDGSTYAGSKTAVFSITTKNIKNTKILDDLFEKLAEMCGA